jgi:hypothetical protein
MRASLVTETSPAKKRKGPLHLGEIVGRVIEPVTCPRLR